MKKSTRTPAPALPPSRVMVMKVDPDGAPRAWAVAPTYGQALKEAERQLEIYKARKRKEGDPLGDAEYTTQTEMVQ